MSDFSGFTQSKLETECDFDKIIIFDDQQPEDFQEWTEDITYDKCKCILPDNTSFDIRIYLDMNNTFDNESFTNFLINRYNESL